MKETELKPCPFCGGKAEIKKGKLYFDDYVQVHCTECGAYIPKTLINHLTYICGKQVRFSEEHAIMRVANIWNRRADNKQSENVIELPCKVGDTVYHIAKCADFHGELDGTLYDIYGGVGSATGYYCPCELRNNCPFDNDEDFDCEKQKPKLAIFEDEVKGFIIGEYEETIILLDYTGNEYIHNFGKTVFLTREEADKALAKMKGGAE